MNIEELSLQITADKRPSHTAHVIAKSHVLDLYKV